MVSSTPGASCNSIASRANVSADVARSGSVTGAPGHGRAIGTVIMQPPATRALATPPKRDHAGNSSRLLYTLRCAEKPLAVIRRSPPQYCGKPWRYCGEDPRVAPRWVLLTCSARLVVGLVTVWRVADLTGLLSGRTNWRREVAAPMRSFLRTEAGSSGVLAAAIVLALLWA